MTAGRSETAETRTDRACLAHNAGLISEGASLMPPRTVVPPGPEIATACDDVGAVDTGHFIVNSSYWPAGTARKVKAPLASLTAVAVASVVAATVSAPFVASRYRFDTPIAFAGPSSMPLTRVVGTARSAMSTPARVSPALTVIADASARRETWE